MASAGISVSGLSKEYARARPARTLRDAVTNVLAAPFRRRVEDGTRHARALDDVSFEVRAGEVIGIIGHNGAGKSTLLKILSRVTDPTAGRAEIRGRVGSLLEVGTGFHGELSGRENIYLSAAILGMSRSEIQRRFDDIVTFSGISGGYLDEPVKKYSSGMYVRLGFAVASHLEPEILLIDEVLSVGDMGFQRKCLQRIRELTRQARVILLVTHNMSSVSGICNRAILLSRGKIAAEGSPSMVIPRYEQLALAGETDDEAAVEEHQGTGQIKVTDLRLLGRDGSPRGIIQLGDSVTVRIEYQASAGLDQVIAYAGVRRLDGFICAGTSTALQDLPLSMAAGPGILEVEFPALSVSPGTYVMDVTFYDENFEHRTYFLGRRRLTFQVESPLGHLDDRYGVFYPNARWNLRSPGAGAKE